MPSPERARSASAGRRRRASRTRSAGSTAAAIRPISSGLAPSCASMIGPPPSSTCSPSSRGLARRGRSGARRSRAGRPRRGGRGRAAATAIVPSSETRGGPALADPLERLGGARGSAWTGSRAAGASAPSAACQTTSIDSPAELPGKRSSMRSAAAVGLRARGWSSRRRTRRRRAAPAATVAARMTIQAHDHQAAAADREPCQPGERPGRGWLRGGHLRPPLGEGTAATLGRGPASPRRPGGRTGPSSHGGMPIHPRGDTPAGTGR